MLLILEILLWINGLILTLVLVFIIAFQLPQVQTFAAQKATQFLAHKLKTKVSVGRFTTDWRNSLVLKEIYIEDQHKDTLLFAGRLGLDLNILALTNQEYKIRTARIENAVLNLKTTAPDSVKNWQFILEAFKSNDKKSSSKSVLEIRNVNLKNTRLTLINEVAGNLIKARLGNLNLEMKPADQGSDVVELGNIELADSKISWLKSKVNIADTSTAKGKQFTFEKIYLENLEVALDNQPAAQKIKVKLGAAEVKADKFSLENSRADLSKFYVENTAIQILQQKINAPDSLTLITEKQPKKTLSKSSGINWALWLHETELKNVSLIYHNYNVPKLPQGLDFNNLYLQDIALSMSNVYYNAGRVSGKLESMQLKEKSGFRLKDMTAKVKAGPDFLELSEFLLKTNNSLIRSDLNITFPPPNQRKYRSGEKTFTAIHRQSRLAPTDLLFLVPDLKSKPYFRKLGRNTLVVNGKISGHMQDLHFSDLNLKGWSGTTINFSGRIKNLQLVKSRKVNINIRRFSTNKHDLDLLTGSGNKAPAFRFPATVSLTGNLQSELNKLAIQNLKISGANGLILQTNGKITGPPGKLYADLDIKNLAVTRQGLLGMLPAGAVTPEIQLPHNVHFAGKFSGASLKHFNLNGNFNTSFGNIYTNIKIRPVQEFSGHISLDNFDLGKMLNKEAMLGPATGKADFEGKGYKVKTMQLHYDADVKKLVYEKETYRNIQLEGNLNEKIYKIHGNLGNAALQGLGHKLKKLKPKNIDLKKADPTRLIPKNIEPKKMIPKMFRKKKKEEPEK